MPFGGVAEETFFSWFFLFFSLTYEVALSFHVRMGIRDATIGNGRRLSLMVRDTDFLKSDRPWRRHIACQRRMRAYGQDGRQRQLTAT
jgi:hypothetical protein